MALCERERCTGCGACVNICPKNCIHMEKDVFGNTYPAITSNACVQCKLCEKSCPGLHLPDFRLPSATYASWSKQPQERCASASGGVATVFSRSVLRNGGVVFGAAIDRDLHVRHISVRKEEDLSKLQGSKYVQSEIGSVYREIKQILQADRQVAFFGTPCQVAGLYGYLRKDYEKLITVDIICHGVPPFQLLDEYRKEHLGKKRVTGYSFRDNNDFAMTFKDGDRTIYHAYYRKSAYLMAFLSGLTYRPNCYQCPYARNKRISDITIGDFWGIGTASPFPHDIQQGVSVLLVNTSKGQQLVRACQHSLFSEERTLDEAVSGNAQLRAPSQRPKNREKFERLYLETGFEKAVHACLRTSFIKYKAKCLLGKGHKNK